MLSILLLLIVLYLMIIYFTQSLDTDKNISKIQSRLISFFGQIQKDYESVELFAIAGTALGCARHKNIIPWDDDMDFGIDESKVEQFLKIAQEKGHKVTEKVFGYQIWDKEVFIDIFVFGEIDGKYHYNRGNARFTWPREYFNNKDDVFPLQKQIFGEIMIPVPRKLNEYCDRSFPGWNKFVKRNYNHHGNDIFSIFLYYTNPFIKRSWLIDSQNTNDIIH